MAAKRTSKPTQPTADVLKAVADLVEPISGAIQKEQEAQKELIAELGKEFNEEADALANEAMAELAQANAFFERNGNLRIHGNFTVEELYEAFKARMNYEIEL